MADSLTSPQNRGTTPAYVELVRTMGTVITLDVRAAERPAGLAAAFADAAERLHQADALFSTWQHESWISRLVLGQIPLDDCPRQVRQVVLLAEWLAELTGGYFSPYWRGRTPPDAGPDPTGLVKGWAAQRASDVLLEHGLVNHVVNAAGDLVLAGSPAPSTTESHQQWRIGISDPSTARELSGVVLLPAGRARWAVATSGTAELGCHVVDPHSGTFPGFVASATTIAEVGAPHREAGAVADACATALVAAGDQAATVLRRLAGHHVRGFLVYADGSVADPDQLLERKLRNP
jgi:FAD:protein FMN transferase